MATKNVVPRASGEGKIGTSVKPWSEVNANAINVSGVPVAPTVSPALSGTPTAPTAAPGNNSTQLASTAFVQSALNALSADVVGPASSVAERIVTFNGTTGKLIKDGGATVAEVRNRSTHTGTQSMSTISDAGTAAILNVAAAGNAASGEVVKGNDTRLTDVRTPSSHASSHIEGGADPIDGDQLKIDVAFSNISPSVTPAEVTSVTHLGAILKGIDNALGGAAVYTAENARDDVGAAMVAGNTNSIITNPNDGADTISMAVQRKTSALIADTQGAIGEDSSGIFVELGTTSAKAASGADSRFPTGDEKAAMGGTQGTPSAANKFVTNTDSRLTDGRTPTAHAASHGRSGSDPIDGDTIGIDWNPTNYTPSTTPAEAASVDDLTAHLYGIDQAIAARVLSSWSQSGTNISASNKALDSNIPAYTLASIVSGDWVPFYDVGAGAIRRANFSDFASGGGGSGPNAGSAVELTIVAGAVAVTGNHHYIDTQSNAASDDLETLGGSPVDGQVVYLYAANDARTVNIKHNAGDIYCWGGTDVVLDADNKAVMAIYSSLYSKWIVIGSSSSGSSSGAGAATELTIASGTITVTGAHHYIDTEANAATDDLTHISGATADGQIVYLYAANDARTILIKHNVGNIHCWGGVNIALDSNNKAIIAIYSTLYTRWMVIGGEAGPLNNYTATAVPSIGDDSADGYGIGSVWYYPAEFRQFVCKSAAASSAVWQEVGEEVTRYEVVEPSTALAVATYRAGWVPKRRFLRDIFVAFNSGPAASPGYCEYQILINGSPLLTTNVQQVGSGYLIAGPPNGYGLGIDTGGIAPGQIIPDKAYIDVQIITDSTTSGFDMYFLWSPVIS